MKSFYTLITCCSLLFVFPVNSQTVGILDTSFNGTGIFIHNYGFADHISDVTIQPQDQKILVTGTIHSTISIGSLLMVRILPGGGFDNTFNGTGTLILNNFFESFGYQSFVRYDNKIIVVGTSTNPNLNYSMLAIRMNEDGSLDSTFGNNGMVTPNISPSVDFAYAVAEQTDHKIILAGIAWDAFGKQVPTVVRLLENGSLDSTFATNGVAYIPVIYAFNKLSDIVIQQDGKIIVSGHFDLGTTGSGQNDQNLLVARFNPDGTPDLGFGSNGIVTTFISQLDNGHGLQLTADNHILVCGYTSQLNYTYDAFIIKYDSTGTVDSTFGTNGIMILDYGNQDIAFDMNVQSDGKILIAGLAGGFFPDDNDFMLARYTSNGIPDSSFGINGLSLSIGLPAFNQADAMDIQADGKIVLTGRVYNGNDNDLVVARYVNDITSSTEELTDKSTFSIFPNPVTPGSEITIHLESAVTENLSISLYDLPGNQVAVFEKNDMHTGNNNHIIKLSSQISAGMYFVKITSSDKMISTGKLIVTK